MSARSKSRKRALDVLYAAEARGVDPLACWPSGWSPTGPDLHSYAPMGEYAESMVRGVVEHQRRIDDLLSEHCPRAGRWTGCRPSTGPILRIAVYELLYSLDVPPAVVVNEAVDAAKLLSTDDSPKFVNGVLGQIAVITPQLRGA